MAIWNSSVENSLFSLVPHFLIGLFRILMSGFLSSLYILETSLLSGLGFVKMFSHSVDYLFFPYWLCPLLYRRSHLFIFALIVCTTGVICRRWSLVSLHCRLLLFYQDQCGQIYIEVFNPFGLSFVHGDRYGSIFILLQGDIQLCQYHLLKMLSFFHCIILAPLSKIRCS